jgi:ATP-dependent helicase HrpB
VQFIDRTFKGQSGFETWPDVSASALTDNLEQWLGPYLNHVVRREHLMRIDLQAALQGLLTWDQQRLLDEFAPLHFTAPSGSRLTIDYRTSAAPILAVKLQALFGLRTTPRIASGRVALSLHLLSPAGRPVQITDDLAGFWANSYFDVRKELRGRYPKHPWPDDPLTAIPTEKTKKALARNGS